MKNPKHNLIVGFFILVLFACYVYFFHTNTRENMTAAQAYIKDCRSILVEQYHDNGTTSMDFKHKDQQFTLAIFENGQVYFFKNNEKIESINLDYNGDDFEIVIKDDGRVLVATE